MSDLAAALGHGPGTRVAILHQDDVGMCHGANRAFLELARTGAISCGAVMVPCPWFPEIAAAARADPALDLGIHLTLTSEWPQYRWGPLSAAGHALADADGYLPRNVPALRARLDIAAAEAELRAQIDRALAAGMRPTHLDTHMGACLAPELRALYLRLGQDYRLPVLLPRAFAEYAGVLNLGALPPDNEAGYAALLRASGAPQVDHFRMTPGVPSAEAEAAYRTLLTSLEPGVTFIALHCNAPGDIETIVPSRAHWRTDEYALFASGRPARWLREAGIVVAGMADCLRAGATSRGG